MAAKSFVSIYFTPAKLQVLKLSANKKRVEKFAAVDLPQGLVMGYGVGNAKALSEVIKKTFASLRIREKSVGLIVPEFSSFIKTIKLPKLGQRDLDEAVRWQAQEFLPSSASDMVMDWRIVKESPRDYQILAIAMLKEALAGFVDAVEGAGLLPLVVESPSLSLLRLASSGVGGKIIIYANFQEVVIVVGEGTTIFGSSVINVAEGTDVVSTVLAATRHYRDIQVEKVYIGGSDVTTELFEKIKKHLAKPIEQIKADVAGLPAQDTQKYLIPYSQQLSSTAGPEEETTINLLPLKWVRKYLNKKLKLQILSLLIISSFFIWSGLGISGALYYYLFDQERTLRADPSVASAQPPAETLAKIDTINANVITVEAILTASKNPQEVLNLVFAAKLADVTLSQYKIDLDTGKVTLAGVSATREGLLQFKKNLEANEDFSLVQIPISSFEVETNLSFVANFLYLPATSKKGLIPISLGGQNDE